MLTLVINPGSTSTKVAVYEDNNELAVKSLTHSKEELSAFPTIASQLDFRLNLILGFLDEAGYPPSKLDCVISRGGAPPNARSGATRINDALVTALNERPKEPHPACLGPVIADKISKSVGIPAFMYDPVSVDELNPLAKIFGVKGIEHDSMAHVLNSHGMSIKVANELGRPYDELTFIVAHFGGGNSTALWHKGRLHDVITGDSGAFSAERCGFMRPERLLDLYDQYGRATVSGWYHGKGGIVSLLGTNDLREVRKMIQSGDDNALLCIQAMAYQLSKGIASLFASVSGDVDGIILTGGGAYLEYLTDEILARLEYLKTPIYLRPGENEMLSLAEGAVRVMNGTETVHDYE